MLKGHEGVKQDLQNPGSGFFGNIMLGFDGLFLFDHGFGVRSSGPKGSFLSRWVADGRNENEDALPELNRWHKWILHVQISLG